MNSNSSVGLLARRDGMPSRALVVDANILVRAVLGKRVREVFEKKALLYLNGLFLKAGGGVEIRKTN